MLVVRRGSLAFEGYYNGHTRNNQHDIRSATKSITSLLVGVAIEQGAVGDVDESTTSPPWIGATHRATPPARNYRWARFDEGTKVDTGGHLLLTPEAVAKIGVLVLQDGSWDGAQRLDLSLHATRRTHRWPALRVPLVDRHADRRHGASVEQRGCGDLSR